MNKNKIIVILVLTVLFLTACSSSPKEPESAKKHEISTPKLSYMYEFLGLTYQDKFLTSDEIGSFDLLKVLDIINVNYKFIDENIELSYMNQKFMLEKSQGNKYKTVYGITPYKLEDKIYVNEKEVLSAAKNLKNNIFISVEINEQEKLVSISQPISSKGYEKGSFLLAKLDEYYLIFNKNNGEVTIGNYRMKTNKNLIDGKIEKKDNNIKIYLYDGQTEEIIDLNLSEI